MCVNNKICLACIKGSNCSKSTYKHQCSIVRGGVWSMTDLLPTRASEQGNVIGLVSVYISICVQKKL